ncbi:MAG: hypothetical protein WDN47_00825 [Candidatus Doudnabacteria bacterium]
MRRPNLGLSRFAGNERLNSASRLSEQVLWEAEQRAHPDDPSVIVLERIKRLSTREGTLANLLRQLLTAEDIKDLDAAIPSLTERCARSGRKIKRSHVRLTLSQLKEEAGL